MLDELDVFDHRDTFDHRDDRNDDDDRNVDVFWFMLNGTSRRGDS